MGGLLGQTAKQGYMECQMKRTPQAPQPPSLASPCPTDPGTEATKDTGDGARAPRDSEVSLASYPTSAVLPLPAHQAGYWSDTPGTPLCPTGPRRSRGAGGRGMRSPRPLPHPAQRQHPGLGPRRCQL